MRTIKLLAISLALGLVPLSACGGGSDDNPFEPGPDGGMTDVGVDGSDDTGDADMGPAPAIENLTVTENPNNVLSAFVELQTDVDAQVSIEVSQGDEVVQNLGPTDTGTEHALDVYGMTAETDYEFAIHADANGKRSTETKTFTTAALPSDFPDMTVEQSTPEKAADGYRVLDLIQWNDEATGIRKDWGMAIIVNKRGEVVWYYKADHEVWDVNRLSNGNLVYNAGHNGVVEIDMAGNIVNEWDAEEDLGRTLENNTKAVHHGIRELDNGRFLTLSTELRQIEGYKEGEDSSPVIGDVGLEFNRDGEVTGTWSMFDVLEDYTTRKRVGSTGPYWNDDYGMPVNDWTHGNAIEPGDTEGTLIASLRHQDWIVKWDRETSELQWRLGPEGDFEFASDEGQFQYHQHAPHWLDNGNLLVYDNGNSRPSIEEGEQFYTRVVEYSIDASGVDIEAGEKGTVEQVWEYRTDPKFYAPYVGDADKLPNGNILIGDGGLLSDPSQCIDFDENGEVVDKTGACITNPDNQRWSRIVEVTHDENKDEVLEVRIRDQSEEDPVNYTMYRSSHLETLYPNAPDTE